MYVTLQILFHSEMSAVLVCCLPLRYEESVRIPAVIPICFWKHVSEFMPILLIQ